MTLLARQKADIHHDVTWLIGALARDLMAHARKPGVLDMLSALSACDFSAARLTSVAATTAPACRVLPEAVTTALGTAQETASAIAAAHEHLPWRAAGAGEDAARAAVLGPNAPMASDGARVELILLAPATTTRLEADNRDLLFFVLSGPSRWRTEGAARLVLKSGQTLFVSAGNSTEVTALDSPLLVAMISA